MANIMSGSVNANNIDVVIHMEVPIYASDMVMLVREEKSSTCLIRGDWVHAIGMVGLHPSSNTDGKSETGMDYTGKEPYSSKH